MDPGGGKSSATGSSQGRRGESKEEEEARIFMRIRPMSMPPILLEPSSGDADADSDADAVADILPSSLLESEEEYSTPTDTCSVDMNESSRSHSSHSCSRSSSPDDGVKEPEEAQKEKVLEIPLPLGLRERAAVLASLTLNPVGWLFDLLREKLDTASESKGVLDLKDHPGYNAVRSTFKAIAKLLLRLLDEEDFELIHCREAMYDQLSEFSAEFDKLQNLNAIIDGTIKMEKYPLLREPYIGFALEFRRLAGCHSDFFKDFIPNLPLFWLVSSTKGFEDAVNIAYDGLMEYNSLKDEMKMHLLMEEFGGGNCRGLEDVLLLDAVKDIEIEELMDLFPEDSPEIGSNLNMLVHTRHKTIQCFSEYVTDPLRHACWMGSFSEEVLDIVRNANFRRRALGERFISASHIMWALRQTGVADVVESFLNDKGSNYKSEAAPAERPPYDIYRNSNEIALHLGVEKVGVEHLALATMFAVTCNCSQQESNGHKLRLRDFLQSESVEKFVRDVSQCKGERDRNGECVGLAEGPQDISFYDIFCYVFRIDDDNWSIKDSTESLSSISEKLRLQCWSPSFG